MLEGRGLLVAGRGASVVGRWSRVWGSWDRRGLIDAFILPLPLNATVGLLTHVMSARRQSAESTLMIQEQIPMY